jgi:hypothetical protein
MNIPEFSLSYQQLQAMFATWLNVLVLWSGCSLKLLVLNVVEDKKTTLALTSTQHKVLISGRIPKSSAVEACQA